MRQRLEWRDVERVQAIGRCAIADARGAEIGQRRQEPRQRLARAGVGHQHGMLARIARS